MTTFPGPEKFDLNLEGNNLDFFDLDGQYDSFFGTWKRNTFRLGNFSLVCKRTLGFRGTLHSMIVDQGVQGAVGGSP